MKRVLSFLSSLLLCLQGSGCTGVSAANGESSTSRVPHIYIVIVDISASRTKKAVDDDQQFLDQLTQKFTYGDQLVLMQMQQEGLEDQAMHWVVSMPVPKDPTYTTKREEDRLSATRQSIKSAIPRFFKAEGKISHTDIFTTLIAASDLARNGREKKKVVVLLSDMLQSTRQFEMKGLIRMPRASWIDEQRRDGLMPQLAGACVVVVGANTTTREGIEVRDFWKRYFSASGAVLSPLDYHIYPPSPDEPVCH